ncbi:hypothetical protein MNAN1_002982 [Malassezia nana]|uniref:Uncharacterized protein n=1 Tax=Malassezia nana TaxID=180528 RepID=A0AAF0ENM4_9BASI|nr:hypothetical protein MNAN1_002982 [Malassezia nana]
MSKLPIKASNDKLSSTPRTSTTTPAQGPRRRRFKDTRELDVLKSEQSYYQRAGMQTPYSSRPVSPSAESLQPDGLYSMPHLSSGLGSPMNASQTSLLRGSKPPGWPGSASPMSIPLGTSAGALSTLSESSIGGVQVPEGMGVGLTDSPYPLFARPIESDAFTVGNSPRGPLISSNTDLLQGAGVYGPAASSSPLNSMVDLPSPTPPEPRSLMQSWQNLENGGGQTNSDVVAKPQGMLSPSSMPTPSDALSPSSSSHLPNSEQSRGSDASPPISRSELDAPQSMDSAPHPPQAAVRSKSPLQQEWPPSPQPPPTTPSKGRRLFGWRRSSTTSKAPPGTPVPSTPVPGTPSLSGTRPTNGASQPPEPKRKGLFSRFKKSDKASAPGASSSAARTQMPPPSAVPPVPSSPTPSKSAARSSVSYGAELASRTPTPVPANVDAQAATSDAPASKSLPTEPPNTVPAPAAQGTPLVTTASPSLPTFESTSRLSTSGPSASGQAGLATPSVPTPSVPTPTLPTPTLPTPTLPTPTLPTPTAPTLRVPTPSATSTVSTPRVPTPTAPTPTMTTPSVPSTRPTSTVTSTRPTSDVAEARLPPPIFSIERPAMTSTTEAESHVPYAPPAPPITDSISSWLSMSMQSSVAHESPPRPVTRPPTTQSSLKATAPPTTVTFTRFSDAELARPPAPAAVHQTISLLPRVSPSTERKPSPTANERGSTGFSYGMEASRPVAAAQAPVMEESDDWVSSVHVHGEVLSSEESSIHEPRYMLRLSRSMQDMLQLSLTNPAVLGADLDEATHAS